MNIIICGAGKVGFSITKQLASQGHSITVIDQSSEDIKKINDSQDVKGIVGRATLPSVLENAGAENTDMIIAVTRNDETNMIICQVASSLFNVPKKIARIRSKEFLDAKWSRLYNKTNIPIDVIISPEIEVAKSLFRRLEAPGALDNVPFANNKLKMLEILVEKNCPLANVALKNLTEKFPDFKANILGAQRDNDFIFLKKNDKMVVGDNVYLIVSSEQLTQILKAFGHEEKASTKILIIGGGSIGLHLAKMLENNFEGARVKIIEKNKERAEEIANELSSSIVINGDALDEEILKEANVEDTETVLALTNDDENNIMACVLAEKSSPNKRTIAIVNKSNYSLLQNSLNIDDLVDPRMTTVSRIMEHVHKGTIGTVYSLLDGAYEFIEAKILGQSELLNKKIKESNLPEYIRIGAILRKEKVIIPKSDFIFEKDDLVVLLAKREHLKEVESIFRITSI
ncbi:Trk system potassium transporter TrkA [Pelagibacteraceae bacterium]|jgi:trk system potassium uptake protein TrkA|nr:Trk system potassium transporter TrkA [Pelagibacteraceae bacterium]|tara:strand:- start:457 stop:1830 length:1374 start_codon:yes stop_codon:yes gene_type:complete